MDETLQASREHFIQGLSQISQFWGFPKAMGAIYAALYLSPEPLSLDELVDQVSVTKGAVSTNVRALERLGMVHPHIRIGERKNFYTAETDFWKLIRGILKEREKSEFDHAIRTVGESLRMIQAAQSDPGEADLASFYKQRLQNMEVFHTWPICRNHPGLDELRIGAVERPIGLSDEKK
jgi:DNA-binding transcriptional regulator GbsR (MarR family)